MSPGPLDQRTTEQCCDFAERKKKGDVGKTLGAQPVKKTSQKLVEVKLHVHRVAPPPRRRLHCIPNDKGRASLCSRSLRGGGGEKRQPRARDEALSARRRVLLQHPLARLSEREKASTQGQQHDAATPCDAPPCRSSDTPRSEARPPRSAPPPRPRSAPAPPPPAPAASDGGRARQRRRPSAGPATPRTRLLHPRRHLRLARLVVHARLGRLARSVSTHTQVSRRRAIGFPLTWRTRFFEFCFALTCRVTRPLTLAPTAPGLRVRRLQTQPPRRAAHLLAGPPPGLEPPPGSPARPGASPGSAAGSSPQETWWAASEM